MADWRELAARGKWDQIDWMDIPAVDHPELLAQLRAVVPMTHDRDGLEQQARYCVPSELKDESLKAAAEFLVLEELGRSVEAHEICAKVGDA